MTPYQLSLLIHLRTSPSESLYSGTELYEQTNEEFRLEGVIRHSNTTDSGWELTDKGIAWLTCILNTPIPKQAWVDENGNIIREDK